MNPTYDVVQLHTDDLWHAHNVLRPALETMLNQNRADWVRRLSRGASLAEAWHLFHNEAARPSNKIRTMAYAELSLVQEKWLAYVWGLPDMAWYLTEQTAGIGQPIDRGSVPYIGDVDGLGITVSIRADDVLVKGPDAERRLREHLSQYPARRTGAAVVVADAAPALPAAVRNPARRAPRTASNVRSGAAARRLQLVHSVEVPEAERSSSLV